MKKRLVVCAVAAFFSGFSLPAWDSGLIVNTTFGYGGLNDDGKFDFTTELMPRFTTFLGDYGEIFISAGLRIGYKEEKEPDAVFVVPELLRTDITLHSGARQITAGRMHYADPLGFVAEGLFDGALASVHTPYGTFSVGTWYTGFLNKERINITMTEQEEASYIAGTSQGANFFDTYSAQPRVISAFGWDHPGLQGKIRAKAAFISQADVSGITSLHSQYFIAKATMPLRDFYFDLGGSIALIQESREAGIGLAGEIGVGWKTGLPYNDLLSFNGRFTSGKVEGSSLRAFLPITTQEQGDILSAKLSGISTLTLNYLARLRNDLSAGLSSMYVIRSDLKTYSNKFGTEGFFLGNEFTGRVIWSLFSDVQLNFQGGVFVPTMGDTSLKDALWRVELNLIVALY